MLYALVDGSKSKAMPGLHGLCPDCKAMMIAKCGEINVWHWAHESMNSCQSAMESDWHRFWKECAASWRCEVPIENHRADIIACNGQIIELQHSQLPPEIVREREEFYRDMLWLIDASQFINNIIFDRKLNGFSFRWRHSRKWMKNITRDLVFDFGVYPEILLKDYSFHETIYCGPDIGETTRTGSTAIQFSDSNLFWVKYFYDDSCDGYGYWINRDKFMSMLFGFPEELPAITRLSQTLSSQSSIPTLQ